MPWEHFALLQFNELTYDFKHEQKSCQNFVRLGKRLRHFFIFASLFVAEARKVFDDVCVKHDIDCPAPRTVARLLDKVGSTTDVKFIEVVSEVKH